MDATVAPDPAPPSGETPLPAPSTAGELIDRLGGNGPVAAALGIGVQAVSNWRSRGLIPWRHHRALLTLASARGVSLTLETLSTINDSRRGS